MEAIQNKVRAAINASGGLLSRRLCFRARKPRYIKNDAIAPDWTERGSQTAFALAHPTTAKKLTMRSGRFALNARRVKAVEKNRAQRNQNNPICLIAKGPVWGVPAP